MCRLRVQEKVVWVEEETERGKMMMMMMIWVEGERRRGRKTTTSFWMVRMGLVSVVPVLLLRLKRHRLLAENPWPRPTTTPTRLGFGVAKSSARLPHRNPRLLVFFFFLTRP